MHSRTTNKATTKEQLWKKNDHRAQKNGSHSNIYWVRVTYMLIVETTTQRGWVRKTQQMDRLPQVCGGVEG